MKPTRRQAYLDLIDKCIKQQAKLVSVQFLNGASMDEALQTSFDACPETAILIDFYKKYEDLQREYDALVEDYDKLCYKYNINEDNMCESIANDVVDEQDNICQCTICENVAIKNKLQEFFRSLQ